MLGVVACNIIFKYILQSHIHVCHNRSLGFATKAKGCKVVGQEGNSGVASHVPESAKSVRDHSLTLPNELPLWELESQMDCRIFRMQLQKLKPIGW
jgi:hypothetical protein